MKKPTQEQSDILARIEQGVPRDSLTTMRDCDRLDVNSFQWSRDGESVLAHRTVRREDACGDARLDYRTELFRIQRDGTVTRL